MICVAISNSVGTELGIDPTIMNLLVGHTVKGIDKSYVAKLRLSVLRAAAQRIADEIDNPQDPAGEDVVVVSNLGAPRDGACVESIGSYLSSYPLPSLESLKPSRHAHYLKRGDLYELVWTAPVSEIAARIGISDVGLAKACRRANIPLPGRGYWARVSAGQPTERDPLPPKPADQSDVIRITGTRTAPSNSKVVSVRDSQATDRSHPDPQNEKAAA
jgi:ribosomal protein S16